MDAHQKVLFVDAATGYYRVTRFPVGDFFGPVDLGLHLAGRYNSLNIGVGLLAGSIFPGSNRLIFTGFSPVLGRVLRLLDGRRRPGLRQPRHQHGVARRPGADAVRCSTSTGRTARRSTSKLVPVDLPRVWARRPGRRLRPDGSRRRAVRRRLHDRPARAGGRAGGGRRPTSAPSARSRCRRGKLSHVDTWAGRGGFGSKMLQQHGIAAVIYGGTFVDEDFRDRKVADQWFQDKYQKKLSAKDLEATVKYRFDPKFETGGTFGVNYATIGGRLLAFNYRSIYLERGGAAGDPREVHPQSLPPAVQRGDDPDQAAAHLRRAVLGRLQEDAGRVQEGLRALPDHGAALRHLRPAGRRAAEPPRRHVRVRRHLGGRRPVLADGVPRQGAAHPGRAGRDAPARLLAPGFPPSRPTRCNNAELGVELLDAIIAKRGVLDLEEGARKLARRLAREKGKAVLDPFVYIGVRAQGLDGAEPVLDARAPSRPWPSWASTTCTTATSSCRRGKLGRINAQRFRDELIMDNLGMCRFHRLWAEEMLPEIIGSLYGQKEPFLKGLAITASRINSRNSSIFWESGAERRLRPHLPEAAPRCGRQHGRGARRVDRPLRDGQARKPP